jgi:general stress protein 26
MSFPFVRNLRLENIDKWGMDQQTDSQQDLRGKEGIEKMQEIAKSAGSCFFCTADSGGMLEARPMNIRDVDDEGSFWFLSAKDSCKNLEIQEDPTVTLFMQGSAHSDFLQVKGQAEILSDRGKIEELWMPLIKTWFTEGKDDPRISVIRVVPVEARYWDTKHGEGVSFVKIVVGAMTGKHMDDSVEGRITLQ